MQIPDKHQIKLINLLYNNYFLECNNKNKGTSFISLLLLLSLSLMKLSSVLEIFLSTTLTSKRSFFCFFCLFIPKSLLLLLLPLEVVVPHTINCIRYGKYYLYPVRNKVNKRCKKMITLAIFSHLAILMQ